MAFTTLAQFKERLELDVNSTADDKAFQQILDDLLDEIESFTGRNFSGNPKTSSDVYDYDSEIILDNMDIRAVSSVRLDGRALSKANGDYSYNLKLGIIKLNQVGEVVEVTYEYGTTDTPGGVNRSFITIATQAWLRMKQERNDPKLSAERTGSVSKNFFALGAETAEGKRAVNSLRRYRRLV